jgi:hypothetical protein
MTENVGTVYTLSVSNQTPAILEFPWLIVIPLLVASLCIAVMLRHRKTANLGK